MIKTPDGQVLVTNDGATILKNIGAMHPAARMVCASDFACFSEFRPFGKTDFDLSCACLLLSPAG